MFPPVPRPRRLGTAEVPSPSTRAPLAANSKTQAGFSGSHGSVAGRQWLRSPPRAPMLGPGVLGSWSEASTTEAPAHVPDRSWCQRRTGAGQAHGHCTTLRHCGIPVLRSHRSVTGPRFVGVQARGKSFTSPFDLSNLSKGHIVVSCRG